EMAKISIVIIRIWQMSGYYMVMFLTGLQTIPDTLYEASKIDGATKWNQLIHITVPMLRPTTFAITILLVLEAFNIFEVVLVMTEGAMSTSSLLYYIYDMAFKTQKMGYASAISWIMFIIVMGFTIIRMTVKKDEVN
ncbi:MAG: sugar ABC transporter permease, partial [Clostridia bacterium]